jgi:hypothetical protein
MWQRCRVQPSADHAGVGAVIPLAQMWLSHAEQSRGHHNVGSASRRDSTLDEPLGAFRATWDAQAPWRTSPAAPLAHHPI